MTLLGARVVPAVELLAADTLTAGGFSAAESRELVLAAAARFAEFDGAVAAGAAVALSLAAVHAAVEKAVAGLLALKPRRAVGAAHDLLRFAAVAGDALARLLAGRAGSGVAKQLAGVFAVYAALLVAALPAGVRDILSLVGRVLDFLAVAEILRLRRLVVALLAGGAVPEVPLLGDLNSVFVAVIDPFFHAVEVKHVIAPFFVLERGGGGDIN